MLDIKWVDTLLFKMVVALKSLVFLLVFLEKGVSVPVSSTLSVRLTVVTMAIPARQGVRVNKSSAMVNVPVRGQTNRKTLLKKSLSNISYPTPDLK